MKTNQPIKLYHHKTDGGAEYLTDKFIVCPDGTKEGIFNDAEYIIRLDGNPELRSRTASDLLGAAKNLLTKIDNITTDDFSLGAEKVEREALRQAIAAAE